MNYQQCDICLVSNRTVKYQTSRVNICQWCITEIIKNYTSAKEIIRINKEIIEEEFDSELTTGLLSFAHAPKAPIPFENKDIYSEAERIIKNKEGLIQSLFRSVFDDSKRKFEINQEYRKIYKEKLDRFEQDSLRYKSSTEAFLKKRNEHLSNKEQIISERFQDWHEDIIFDDSYKSLSDKILRAYHYGLITGDDIKIARLSPDEMKPIRDKVLKEDSYTCVKCKDYNRDKELHVHHIIPLDNYGTHNPSNLATLCYSCHNAQHQGMRVTRHVPIKRTVTGGVFIAVDIETTGFSNNDRIIEMAAIKFSQGKPERKFRSLINPEISIPDKISKLTGITDDMVISAPTLDIVFPRFLTFIKDHKLVFHNASFDLRFIKKYADNQDITINNEIIDTLKLSREKIPYLNNHKLNTLVNLFDIYTEQEHRAYSDALATGMVYINCLKITKAMIKKKQIKA